jgi:hypothetical protein
VPPKLGFNEDTPSALDAFGLPQLPKLALEPKFGNAPLVYMGALVRVFLMQDRVQDRELRSWHCPCFKHRPDVSTPFSPERPLGEAVLLLQRRLPRTIIPRLLRHREVRDLPVEALPPRLHFGSVEPLPDAPPCMWCARIAAATLNVDGVRDLRTNPNLRRASHRGQADDWLWTPAFADVDPAVIGPERYADACAHFQWHWRRRQFPVVRNIQSVRCLRCPGLAYLRLTPCALAASQRLDWGPGSMRVLLERAARAEQQTEMEVLICRTGHPAACTPKEFIDGYGDLMLEPMFGKSHPGDMLKLKDWPPRQSFADTVPRQYGALPCA